MPKKANTDEEAPMQQLQEGLKLMRQCPVCKKEYGEEHMNVLEEYQGSHLVHLTCPYCMHAVLAVVMVSSFGLSSVGIMTDLHAQDVVRLRKHSEITDEDILDFHMFLSLPSQQFEKMIIHHRKKI